MSNKIHCFKCEKNYSRLDMHVLTIHKISLGEYLKEFYVPLENISSLHYDREDNSKSVCQICQKKVTWIQDHIEQEHRIPFTNYLETSLILYTDFIPIAQNKIHKHYQLKVWDCFLFYKERIERMVHTFAYKYSLPEVIGQELYGKALEKFYKFHHDYDPHYETTNPNFLDGKTLDYYEKYMLLKIHRQLWYSVQKYHIDINREYISGTATDLEYYNPTSVALEDYSNLALWNEIKGYLKPKQVTVLELILQGYSQKEISETLSLTQSWVSSIKTGIIETIKLRALDDPEFKNALEDYYDELTTR